MIDVPPAPVIPDDVTLVTDLPPTNWPLSAPRLRVTYLGPRHMCEFGAYLPHPETRYMQHSSTLVLRELARQLADATNHPDLIDLHRDICFWAD